MKLGHTLIEVLVVLAIAGVLAITVFWGLGMYNRNQYLSNAQHEFLTNLRSVQNRVLNGSSSRGFEAVKIENRSTYIIGNSTVKLPAGVTIVSSSLPLFICFAHPLLASYDAGQCGNCSGKFFACDSNGRKMDSGELVITFSSGATERSVVVEGTGITVNRVFAR